MNLRNVQRTGDMFYVYLPTSWCKKYNISNKSKLQFVFNSDGSLSINPHAVERTPFHLEISLQGEDIDTLHKAMVASYINPAASFKITMSKEMDTKTVLQQKKLFSLEMVELDGKHITCESSMNVLNPESLLKTMLKKVKNLLSLMQTGAEPELMERYEEEIDRSKMLIEKSVISSLVNNEVTNLSIIDLHYIALLSKDLEHMVDHLVALKEPTKEFLATMQGIIKEMEKLISAVPWGKEEHEFICQDVVKFNKIIKPLKQMEVKNPETYNQRRVHGALNHIAEILMDIAVTKTLPRY